MFFFTLWPDGGGFSVLRGRMGTVMAAPGGARRIGQVLEVAHRRDLHVPFRLRGMDRVPLMGACRYSREELLAARRQSSIDGPRPTIAKVCVLRRGTSRRLHLHSGQERTGLLPTTMYRDYAISPELSALGIAEHHQRRVTYRASGISTIGSKGPKYCSSPANTTTATSAPSPTSSWGQPAMSVTRAAAPSPLLGSSNTRCPPTSSKQRRWSPTEAR